MQRRPDPRDYERMRQQGQQGQGGAAAPGSENRGSRPDTVNYANGARFSQAPQPSEKLWPDESDVNPPWEIDSGRLPAMRPASAAQPPADLSWELDSAVEQSYPS